MSDAESMHRHGTVGPGVNKNDAMVLLLHEDAYVDGPATAEGALNRKKPSDDVAVLGARVLFFTLVPIRFRSRGERRSLRTFAGVSLRPHHAFDPRPRRLSTPSDAYEHHPAIALYGTTLRELA